MTDNDLQLCESEVLGGIREYYPRDIADVDTKLILEWVDKIAIELRDRGDRFDYYYAYREL